MDENIPNSYEMKISSKPKWRNIPSKQETVLWLTGVSIFMAAYSFSWYWVV